jgi:hypothetical protein
MDTNYIIVYVTRLYYVNLWNATILLILDSVEHFSRLKKIIN